MALTEEQLQHYYREGYVIVPGLIPPTSVEAVLAAAPPTEGEGGGWGRSYLRPPKPAGPGRDSSFAGGTRHCGCRPQHFRQRAARSLRDARHCQSPWRNWPALASGQPVHPGSRRCSEHLRRPLRHSPPTKLFCGSPRAPIGWALSRRRKAPCRTPLDTGRRWSNRRTECRCRR